MGNRGSIEWGAGWHWPLPDLKTRDGVTYLATVSQEFRGTGSAHKGVDLMYRRRSKADRKEYPAGVNQSERWFVPPGAPVLAARAGKVWSVARTPLGWAVTLDHGAPWATYYLHLEGVVSGLAKGVPVAAGEKLGTVGYNPNREPKAGVVDAARLRHLHFEAWYKGTHAQSVDPGPVIVGWERSLWTL